MGAKKFFIIGFILVILAAIPLTLYLLQKQQETRSHAAAATIISFTNSSGQGSTQTAPFPVVVGSNIDLDVQLDPKTNVVAYVKLVMTFDSTKFSTAGAGFMPSNAFSAPLLPVLYEPGKVTVELGAVGVGATGVNSTGVVQTAVKVGTLTLKADNPTTAPSPVNFVSGETIVYSVCPPPCADTERTNVLSSATPAFLASSGTAPTPTSLPGPTAVTGAPICTALNADRTVGGTAPFSVVFTAIGKSDPSTTISKASFNFGDGPLQDIISGGGIGTKQVSVQSSHTYNNAGTYKANVILTDGHGLVSDPLTCSTVVNVTTGPTLGPGAPGPIATPTPTLVFTPTPTDIPTPTQVAIQVPITSPGPGDTFVKIGAGAGILSIIGAAIFLLAL